MKTKPDVCHLEISKQIYDDLLRFRRLVEAGRRDEAWEAAKILSQKYLTQIRLGERAAQVAFNVLETLFETARDISGLLVPELCAAYAIAAATVGDTGLADYALRTYQTSLQRERTELEFYDHVARFIEAYISGCHGDFTRMAGAARVALRFALRGDSYRTRSTAYALCSDALRQLGEIASADAAAHLSVQMSAYANRAQPEHWLLENTLWLQSQNRGATKK